MKARKQIVTALVAGSLAVGAVVLVSPGASALPQSTACTAQARAEAKAAMTDARSQIAATRLTDQQRAQEKADLKAAIAALKAKARADAGGATLTPEQKTQLKTEIAVLVQAHKDKVSARHATIEALKTQLSEARTTLRNCRA